MEAELIDLLSAVRPAILHHLHSLDVQSCSDVVGVWGSCAHFCHGRTTKRLVGVLVCDCTSSHKGNAFVWSESLGRGAFRVQPHQERR